MGRVEGSPSTLFLVFILLLQGTGFGTGFNVYQEKSGVNENLFASGAFAYHLRFTDENMIFDGSFC